MSMENKSAVLSATGLSFSYEPGVEIIHSIDLEISSGKITSVIGANGSGKSTLFHLLTGALKPGSGCVSFKGVRIQDISRKELARQVSIVHQHNMAPEDMTVRKLVSLGRTPYQSLLGWGQNPDDEKAVNNALKLTNTEMFSDRVISSLSGGQKQRVWLAMALAQSAEVVLLDEITTYLDIHYQLELLGLLNKLNEEQGTTIVMVLHDINQAIAYSDEMIVMHEGSILASGNTEETICEEVIDRAFNVKTHIQTLFNNKYCIYELNMRGRAT